MNTEDPGGKLATATRYQVGDLTVDLGLARVTRHDVELPLPRLSFDLLVALMEAAPALVTTDRLLDRVWPGLVVNPETVAQRVKLLRGALGDDPRQPRYIHVTRGRGYRLVAEVRPVYSVPRSSVVQTSSATAPEPVRGPRLLHWAAGVSGALLAASLLWLSFRPTTEQHTVALPAATLTQRSVAVLPFRSLGDAADDRVLSLGIAEAVLHQLATLGDLTVIARSSSFALEQEGLEARAVGQRLGVQFVLEGSVQRLPSRLRITTQLVDTSSGASLWSLQFDRGIQDVFAMQDEIALKVAQALRLSLDVPSTDRASGQGTQNFDAYFEYLQARSIVAEGRTADLPLAFEHLRRALQIDPDFARAQVELADVIVQQAEFSVGPDRGTRFEAALPRALQLVERALQLDPDDGRAYLQRAYLLGFSDLLRAERDYRRGLALAPNDASGYERLAALLFQDRRRHDESLLALERARRLDPLEPRYDVTKAVFLFYGRGNVEDAKQILRDVVEREPQYAPGLIRLGEVELMTGNLAAGVRLLELGRSLDPSAEQALRELAVTYLGLRDVPAARALIASQTPAVPARDLPLHIFRRDWAGAGDEAYLALQSETWLPYDEALLTLALRRHARITGEIREALATLEQLAGLDWGADGRPMLPASVDMRSAAAGAADLLLLVGEKARGEALLQAILDDIDRDARERHRDGRWTRMARAEALAMRGRLDEAMRELERCFEEGHLQAKHWVHLYLDPSFDGLRGRADFQNLIQRVETHITTERRKLDDLRRSGLVPVRGTTGG